ncbi:MAG: lysophospholipase [Arenicella sp.]|jgi:lysophospholipase
MLTFLKRGTQFLLGLVFFTWLVTFLAVKFEKHQYTQITAEQRTQASNYLLGKVTLEPSNLNYQTFTPVPGVGLRTAIVDAENAKGTIVFVPGFTGTIEMAMETITQLNSAGFRVAAIEYRGQGKSYRPISNPEKGYVEDFGTLANDVAKFARHVKRNGEPLFFFSISKGAHITMRMAAEQGVDVRAFALVVPMIQIDTGELSYSFVSKLAHILNAIGLGNMYAPGNSQWPPQPLVFGEANGCNSNPESAQLQSAMFALNETLRTRGATIKWLKETTDSTEKLLSPGFMNALIQPVKIFTAGDDRLVRTDVATKFCTRLANCEVTHFEKARHCINRESQERMNKIIRQSVAHYEKALS